MNYTQINARLRDAADFAYLARCELHNNNIELAENQLNRAIRQLAEAQTAVLVAEALESADPINAVLALMNNA